MNADSTAVELVRVDVDLWHPGCWTLRTTRDHDGGLLGHGTNVRGGTALGRFTAYGESGDAVAALVAAVDDSDLTDEVVSLPGSPPSTRALGPVTRDVAVTFDAGPSVRGAFADRGFVHCGPTRHEGGTERRSLLVRATRADVRRALDEVATDYDAEVDLRRLGPAASDHERDGTGVGARLSTRQADAIDLARRRGYYEYPRETTTAALAADFGVSKSTFLEHLRKAERKLLARDE